jgi:hypothetical protein
MGSLCSRNCIIRYRVFQLRRWVHVYGCISQYTYTVVSASTRLWLYRPVHVYGCIIHYTYMVVSASRPRIAQRLNGAYRATSGEGLHKADQFWVFRVHGSEGSMSANKTVSCIDNTHAHTRAHTHTRSSLYVTTIACHLPPLSPPIADGQALCDCIKITTQ